MAFLMTQRVVDYFEADVDDYFSKPFHPSELAARVARMVRRGVGVGSGMEWPASRCVSGRRTRTLGTAIAYGGADANRPVIRLASGHTNLAAHRRHRVAA